MWLDRVQLSPKAQSWSNAGGEREGAEHALAFRRMMWRTILPEARLLMEAFRTELDTFAA